MPTGQKFALWMENRAGKWTRLMTGNRVKMTECAEALRLAARLTGREPLTLEVRPHTPVSRNRRQYPAAWVETGGIE